MAAAVVLLAAVSMACFDLVSRQNDVGMGAGGTTILEPEPAQKEAKDRTRLNEPEDAFTRAETDKERKRIITEASELLRDPVPSFDVKGAAQH